MSRIPSALHTGIVEHFQTGLWRRHGQRSEYRVRGRFVVHQAMERRHHDMVDVNLPPASQLHQLGMQLGIDCDA